MQPSNLEKTTRRMKPLKRSRLQLIRRLIGPNPIAAAPGSEETGLGQRFASPQQSGLPLVHPLIKWAMGEGRANGGIGADARPRAGVGRGPTLPGSIRQSDKDSYVKSREGSEAVREELRTAVAVKFGEIVPAGDAGRPVIFGEADVILAWQRRPAEMNLSDKDNLVPWRAIVNINVLENDGSAGDHDLY
jgi:hypothetical protein